MKTIIVYVNESFVMLLKLILKFIYSFILIYLSIGITWCSNIIMLVKYNYTYIYIYNLLCFKFSLANNFH